MPDPADLAPSRGADLNHAQGPARLLFRPCIFLDKMSAEQVQLVVQTYRKSARVCDISGWNGGMKKNSVPRCEARDPFALSLRLRLTVRFAMQTPRGIFRSAWQISVLLLIPAAIEYWARPDRFELPTLRFVVWCSQQAKPDALAPDPKRASRWRQGHFCRPIDRDDCRRNGRC
jgi:hypothetical protein